MGLHTGSAFGRSLMSMVEGSVDTRFLLARRVRRVSSFKAGEETKTTGGGVVDAEISSSKGSEAEDDESKEDIQYSADVEQRMDLSGRLTLWARAVRAFPCLDVVDNYLHCGLLAPRTGPAFLLSFSELVQRNEAGTRQG